MEVPQGKSAINRYQLKEQHLLHRYKEPCQNYDLMGIVFVYLGNSKVKEQLLNLSRFYKRERFNWNGFICRHENRRGSTSRVF